MSKGFLYSQIGYDLFQTKYALVKDDIYNAALTDAAFKLVDSADKKTVFDGQIKYWGERNNQHWWMVDFSDFDGTGNFEIVFDEIKEYMPEDISATVDFENNILFDASFEQVGIKQFEDRQVIARNQLGWKDCGANFRETYDHAIVVIELCHAWYTGCAWMTPEQSQRLLKQIENGISFLELCNKLAMKLGAPKGSFVNEIPDDFRYNMAVNSYLCAYAFAFAARIMRDYDFDKCDRYLEIAKDAFDLLCSPDYIITRDKFGHYNQGAPEGYVPPREWATRDLFMLLNSAIELVKNGMTQYIGKISELTEQILSRQVTEAEAQEGIYGHFYAFSDRCFTEKICCHRGGSSDNGLVYPMTVNALLKARGYVDAELEKKIADAVYNFTYKYFIPSARLNPFNILPMGYFDGKGWLDYCGTWHGTNATYGILARIAFQLASYFEDRQIADIGYCHLQWIAGVNFGVDNTTFEGTSNWKDKYDHDFSLPKSQIVGIGKESVYCWTPVKGSIPNGYCTNKQFRSEAPVCKENDAPIYYSDEDWIPHAAAWASALVYLRHYNFFFRRDIDVRYKGDFT